MKLKRVLTIGAKTYPLIEERVLLTLNGSGKAQFLLDAAGETIEAFKPIALDVGYTQHGLLSRLFLGYIEQAVKVDARRVRVFCRELAAVLQGRLAMNLRHPTLKGVLKDVHAQTQLNFSIPDKGYSTTRIPHFSNLGNGYQAIDTLGRVFQIDDFIWQQQGGGVVYVGSWSDSRWKGREVVFPESMFKAHLSSQSAEIAAVPEIRPGAVMNGKRLIKVEFAGNAMTVTWQ
jgi:hypothetical protein